MTCRQPDLPARPATVGTTCVTGSSRDSTAAGTGRVTLAAALHVQTSHLPKETPYLGGPCWLPVYDRGGSPGPAGGPGPRSFHMRPATAPRWMQTPSPIR